MITNMQKLFRYLVQFLRTGSLYLTKTYREKRYGVPSSQFEMHIQCQFAIVFGFSLLDIDHNVCSIHFLGVSINFDPIAICQRSPKVMQVEKSVYFIYPGVLKMFTVVMFTNELHYYLMDMVSNICTIQFLGVANYLHHIGMWQRSPKVMKVEKSVYFMHHCCLMRSPVFQFTIIFTYYLLDIDHNTQSIQFKGVPNF